MVTKKSGMLSHPPGTITTIMNPKQAVCYGPVTLDFILCLVKKQHHPAEAASCIREQISSGRPLALSRTRDNAP
jgi:hypothetical protein